MKINPSSHVPIYRQIADGIREAVAAGVYLAGEPLPSLRVLAIEVQVNPNTVQRAYDELSREGLIYSERGKGLFVAEAAAEGALDSARDTVGQVLAEGVRAGRAAGLSDRDLRELFRECLSSKVSSVEK